MSSVLLPGLAPHHTRASIGSRSRLYVEKYASSPDDFIETDRGLWLLPSDVAVRDMTKGAIYLGATAERQFELDLKERADMAQKASRLLLRSEVDDNGCIRGGLKWNQNLGDYVLYLAEQDWGSPSFQTSEEIEEFRVCDTGECYNTRHFNLEFGRMLLKEKMIEVNPYYYHELENGQIETLWRDKLPSIEDSLRAFKQFKKHNYPFVPRVESRLSATSTAQVQFHPLTGCWESWAYYTKPQDDFNWQFDGYGRLYQTYKKTVIDSETGEISPKRISGHWLAHRVIWVASGRRLKEGKVLNHLCSYRRCCNPLHLEQVTPSENVHHGIRVKRATQNVPNIMYTPSLEERAMLTNNLITMFDRVST